MYHMVMHVEDTGPKLTEREAKRECHLICCQQAVGEIKYFVAKKYISLSNTHTHDLRGSGSVTGEYAYAYPTPVPLSLESLRGVET